MTQVRLELAMRVLAFGLSVIAPAQAFAQQVEIQVERGPHYAGEPIRVVVTATGFDEEPTPEIEVPEVEAGRLDLQQISPSVNRQIQITNGRIEQSLTVSFAYEFSYVSETPGEVVLPAFRVSQGGAARSTQRVRLRISRVARSDEIAVELQLPESPIYVGARLPVYVRFYLSESIRENLQSFSLHVPFFSPSQDFRFLDDEASQGDTKVPITRNGAPPFELLGSARRVHRGGKDLIEVTVARTLVPLRAGSHDVAAPILVVDEGTRWRRDFFGRRTASRIRKLRTVGKPTRIAVENVPLAGRPESFAGAVGRGFSLEVTADRTVVQVGDPIELTLVLGGEGLETASLPPLDAKGLLRPEQFRVPGGSLPGVLDGDTKRFSATVRVLDELVREIPPLEYAWFDPDSKTYQTTRSRPIALAVRSAEIIGAAQVESQLLDPEEEPRKVAEAQDSSDPAPRARSFALSGADLAVERDPERLLRSGRGGGSGGLLEAGLYGISLALVALAVVDRRRRNVDPALLRRRALLADQVAKMRDACSLPDSECADEFSKSLRRMLAEVPDASAGTLRGDIDAFLGECDARSYAPPGQGADLDDVFRDRGRELSRLLAESAQ